VVDEDARLVERFVAGDRRAFDRLVERWRTPLVRYLDRFLGDRERAEDLAQEVFVNLFRHAARYQPQTGARFSSYLFRMATNAGLNERRRLARRLQTEPLERGETGEVREVEDAATPSAEARVRAGQAEAAVRRALAALPERQAAALVMASYHGLSLDEIGRSLGVSDRAVKSLLNRARESLRRLLAPLLEVEA